MHTPPKFLFVQINKRCNLRCGHCDFWMRDDDDKANYQPWQRQREILQEFSELNPEGAVVICGGEPMLDLNDYFAVTRECMQLGLRSVSVINGTRIRTPIIADAMLLEGPEEISISLNSHIEELHDRTRGVKGAFRKGVKALRLLVDERHPDRRTRIYVMGLVFDENYHDLDGFYDFVLNDIKADKLKLNFLQPSFGHDVPNDRFFAEHGHLDPQKLGAVIEACDAKYRLGLNPIWLEQVKMYFRSLNAYADLDAGWGSEARSAEHICGTYDRNIMVDHYGMARLCFADLYRGVRLKKYGDLRDFWENADDIRAEMRECNRLCGISHSVRREPSTIAGRIREIGAPPRARSRAQDWIAALRQRISPLAS